MPLGVKRGTGLPVCHLKESLKGEVANSPKYNAITKAFEDFNWKDVKEGKISTLDGLLY